MTRQLAQCFQCLMVRDDFELKPHKSQEFKLFRGGVLLFEYALDASNEHIAWGAWSYRYMPQDKRSETSQDDLCPPNFKVGKFRDTQFWVPKTAYGEGPLAQGLFYNEKRIDAQSIDWLKNFCHKQGLGIANLDGFIHFVLLAPQPVRKTKAGGYVYRIDEPKLVFAYDLDDAAHFLAYGSHEARNTKYDRTRHGQPIFEMCECQSKRRNGERIGPCNHASDVLVKELGDTYAVESYRRIIYRPQNANDGCITCHRTTPVSGEDWAIIHQEGLRSAKLLEFIPAERLFGALGIQDVEKRDIERPDFEPVPSEESIENVFTFLGDLHGRYLAARKKFESYELPIPVWKVYSGGSLAKAMLRKFGIKPFREQNPGFSLEVLSCFRAADYGGRVETLEILKPILSAHLDFCSEYPAVASLLGIQRFLVAEKVKPVVIDGLPEWVSKLNIGALFDREIWPHLCGVCLVQPNSDFLPFRSSESFRVRTVEAGEPYFVALPDIVASILKTNRIPEVLTTILLMSEGTQKGVRPAKFFGGKVLDPRKDDIFVESVFGKQSGTIPKQVANALAYGLHGEINPERGPHSKGLTIFCAGRKFHRKSNRLRGDLAKGFQEISERLSDNLEAEETEEAEEGAEAGENRLYFPVEAMGEFYGPLATLVASGGRLLLQMLLDVSLAYELEHIYANTDCAILEYPDEGSARAFYERINAIQSEFERLSPYASKEAVGRKSRHTTEPEHETQDIEIEFLQLKPYSYTKGGCFRPAVYFSVGSTRYVEFSLGTSIATIRHISQGGSGAIEDPDGYNELSLADIGIDKNALEADCPRKILADAWKVATAMVIDWQRDKVFSRSKVTGKTFCTYLRKRLETIKNFHQKDKEGRPYIDRIVDYFDPIDPDDPNKAVASWRQFVIGKEPRREGDRIHPLFEIEGTSIVNITTPFCHEAQPENPFFQLYIEGLWFKFVEQVVIPNLYYFKFADKEDVISEARRIAIQGEFHFLCGTPLRMFEDHAVDFLDLELIEKAKMNAKNAEREKAQMNQKNAERHRAKVDFLKKVNRTLKIDADRYEKIKRSLRRLKGSNDWFPQLDAGNLQALDAMMNDWRSSGSDYWTWREEQKRESHREKAERQKAWHANHNESPEAKAAERREKKAEWARSARSAATEKSKVDVISLNTLTPEPVPTPPGSRPSETRVSARPRNAGTASPPHVRLSVERAATPGSTSKRRTASPGHKQAFKVGMAVVKWRDGDAEDAKARVLPPTFAAELAALTLELTPEERVRLSSIKRADSQDKADEKPRISQLDIKSLAELDYLSPREKPNRLVQRFRGSNHIRPRQVCRSMKGSRDVG